MRKQPKTLFQWPALVILSLACSVVNAQSLEAILGWSNRTELSSAVSGMISRVDVVAGQRVKKGEILIQLSQPVFNAQVAKAKAKLLSEKEELAEAKRELERALELYERTVLAEHELQMAKNFHKKAQANYKKAQADYVKANTEHSYSTIKAPFDAVIIKVMRKKDEVVNASIEAPLMVVVAEAEKMIAESAIPADMLGDVKLGRSANVEVGGKTYRGKVNFIGLEFNEGTNLYPVSVEFATDKSQLRAGMKASIYF